MEQLKAGLQSTGIGRLVIFAFMIIFYIAIRIMDWVFPPKE